MSTYLERTVGYQVPNTDTFICKEYPEDDRIWNLPNEKRVRKLIADVRKDLQIEADRLVQIMETVRG